MLDAITFNEMIENLNEKKSNGKRTIGILLSQPNSEFVKTEILNRIEYYYSRSGEHIDFYFPGYGAYWPIDKYPDMINICQVNNVQWSFSTKYFIEFVDRLELISEYRYSGETELIIIDYYEEKFDFSKALVFWLDRMVKDQVIYSVPNFFEKLFREFKTNRDTFGLSDVFAVNQIAMSLFDNAVDKIPFGLGKTFMKTKYFCTSDIEIK